MSKSDILVENYIPGKLDRFGLGYEHMVAVNPSLIYCSISGFGSKGPYAQRGGYDVIAGAYAGLVHVTGPKVYYIDNVVSKLHVCAVHSFEFLAY